MILKNGKRKSRFIFPISIVYIKYMNMYVVVVVVVVVVVSTGNLGVNIKYIKYI